MMASRPILVILPQLPPAVCGVGDYTTRLLTEWGDRERFQFALLRGEDATRKVDPELRVETVAPNAEAMKGLLKRHPDAHVFVQYIPFGMHPKGCPLWLIDALKQWHAIKNPEVKLVVMFHELWAVQPWWKPMGFIQWRHRNGIAKLLSIADGVFTNTEGYAEWIANLPPHKKATVAPVGSNIVPGEEVEREKGLFVLFGKQGTRIHAVKEFGADIKRLYEAGRLKKLLMLGGGGAAMQAQEDEVLRACLPEGAFETPGFMSEAELSSFLARAEFALSTQTWASVTKSTTFMAYAAHGTNILHPLAGKDERVPFNWLTGADELLSNGDDLDAKLAERSKKLRNWYEANASWPSIAAKFKGAFADAKADR